MKTAMQEAIEYLRKCDLLSAAIIIEDKFIEIEKWQIVHAVDRMTNMLIANEIITESGCTDDSTYGEIYYNQIFNQQS